jgi:hypothetical protein
MEGSVYGWESHWDGLPALSPDGASVAYAYVADDGGRGFPNLYVDVVPVGGDKERTTAIFTAEEVANEDFAQPKLPDLIRRRVAEMNTRLRGWSPMATQAQENAFEEGPQVLSVAGLDFHYEAPKITVKERGRDLLARSLAGGPASSDACDYASRLHSASADTRRRVLVVGLRFAAPPDWCPTIDVYRTLQY